MPEACGAATNPFRSIALEFITFVCVCVFNMYVTACVFVFYFYFFFFVLETHSTYLWLAFTAAANASKVFCAFYAPVRPIKCNTVLNGGYVEWCCALHCGRIKMKMLAKRKVNENKCIKWHHSLYICMYVCMHACVVCVHV